MRREWSSLRFHGSKAKASSIPQPFSCLSMSSMSPQTRRHVHRYRQELEPEEDFDEWVYTPFHCGAVSSLDEESKWSVHYTAPWHQQENVFLQGGRPPCVEELHHQAKVNLKTVFRECDKLRKDGFRSSQYYSQGPAFSSPILLSESLDQDETEKKKKRSRVLDCLSESCLTLCCHLKSWKKKSSESSAEEEKLVYSMGPQMPLLENICDINTPSCWSKSLPLPTPEEKMRQQAQSVATDIVPIDITGESFDRQASFRRTLSNTDTVTRRSKKIKRRKTITGVPDNVQRELAAKEQGDIRTHSVYMAGQYSTLGHSPIVNSTLKHSASHESDCQTDDIKILPPSMRRIRAQRGSGIAAKMANISLSSSGSISNMSDYNGATYTPQHNGRVQDFHSLPRQGTQNSLQQQESKYTVASCKMVNGSTSSLLYQFNMQHVTKSPQQKTVDSRENAVISPKSAQFQGFQNGQQHATPGYMVSSSNKSPAPFFPNGDIQNLSDFSSAHSAQNFNTEETLQAASSCTSDHPFSFTGTSVSAGSSRCQSPASLLTATHSETESQCSTLNGRSCNSPIGVLRDSDFSESSPQSCSTLTIDQWAHETPPKGQHTSNCSSPVRHVYNSLERSPTKTDSSSLFSVDTEGYFTSMHLDSGLKSYSHGCINKAGKARSNLYECREHHSQGDRGSLHSNQSLTRSISLRKAKKPPLPPKRTDSLKRKPQRKPHHSETILNEQLISSLQESLKNNSASFSGQSFSSEFEDPWMLRPRSQSAVSGASSGMSAPAAVCPVTPAHSDSSSQHSEYADSWDFYTDFPCSRSEQGPCSPGGSARGFTKISDNSGFHSDDCNSKRVTTSPDKVHHVTSPSSGYSSQSITPTAGTPVTSLLRAKSPAGRPKPKVPERKSSLRSSVSSSATSLSSNTSDLIRNLPTPPPLPTTLPGLVTLHSTPSLSNCPISPAPASPSLLPMLCTLEKKQSSPSRSPTTTVECKASNSISLGFPPPPSEISDSQLVRESTVSPPQTIPPAPPPPLLMRLTCDHTPPPPPPLPGMGLHAETILKTENFLITVKSEEGTKEPNSDCLPEVPHRPLITAQALQLVQLRPIKLMKLENIFTDIVTTVCASEDHEQSLAPETSLYEPVKEILENIITPVSASPQQSRMDTPDKELIPSMLNSLQPSASPKLVSSINFGNVLQYPLNSEPVRTPSATNLQEAIVSSMAVSPQKQKPPISPMKPGLSLIMPPVLCQLVLNGVENTSPEESSETEALNSTPPLLQEIPFHLEAEAESDSGHSTPLGPKRVSLSSEFSSDSLNDPQFTAFMFNEPDLELSDNDLGPSDERGITDDGSSSSSGLISFKEEENDAVFDSSTDISSPASPSMNEEAVEELVTPALSRTTEDLFAVIHRSKRKVLGRGDSEEERSRSIFPSPPVTPTGACPGLPSLPRQTGYIQRSLRRSTTSNNSFKALLLKKGSRSEPGYRMSAAEMLKCTNPRLQRPSMEALVHDSLCTSPAHSRRVSDEWARAEGSLPRLSPGPMPSKYGRSSTPPSATSSRYNSRSRIPSGPMTVICEKEGELTESVDSCLSAEIPFPMSLASTGTVCPQGST